MAKQYNKFVPPVREGFLLGAVFLAHWYIRAGAGCFGPNRMPRALIDAAWIDGGYSIDAPGTMPAGGCRSLEFEDDPFQMAEQITFEREPWL